MEIFLELSNSLVAAQVTKRAGAADRRGGVEDETIEERAALVDRRREHETSRTCAADRWGGVETQDKTIEERGVAFAGKTRNTSMLPSSYFSLSLLFYKQIVPVIEQPLLDQKKIYNLKTTSVFRPFISCCCCCSCVCCRLFESY